jgi:hypothetical protein
MDQMVTEYKELIALQQTRVDGFLAETISSVSEATCSTDRRQTITVFASCLASQ